jgi:phosphate transport system substrate-binding protein
MKAYSLIIAALFAVATLPGFAQSPSKTFTIAGSGSNIALTQELLDAYAEKTGARVLIPPSIGTLGAIKALQANALNLGLASRPLKAEEKASGLKELPYARLGIILAVHSSVPERDITGEDLVAIYKGTKNRWSSGKMIIVLAREAGDSSNLVLEKFVPGFKEALAEALAKKRWDVFYTDQEEFDATRATMNSLGLVDTSAILSLSPQVAALSFNGIKPELSEVESGKYPLWKDLSFIFKEPLPAVARGFVEFVESEAGGAVLRSHGALPVPKGK